MTTTDKNEPLLNKVKDNGQNDLVMTEEEKSKGYIRPFRDSYIHVGINWNKTPHEIKPSDDGKYAAILYYVQNENGKFIGGQYITQKELNQIREGNGFTGGCGTVTKMNNSIAETYAVNPKFYNSTFCVGCGKHLPVSQFVWKDTNEEVGS
jgi:hypothetical protein